MKEKKTIDWRRVPEDVAARAKDLWSASLGLAAAVEQKGEEIIEAVSGDRAELMDRLQHSGSKALDDLQTQANRIFDDLVTRGEQLQKDGRKAVKRATRQLAEGPKSIADDMTQAAEKAVTAVMHRMDVPSRKELGRLADRVEKLTQEVQRLAGRLGGETESGQTSFEVAPLNDAWVVRNQATFEVLASAETKAGAVREGREIAKAAAPSELRILRLDGSLQDVSSYGEVESATA